MSNVASLPPGDPNDYDGIGNALTASFMVLFGVIIPGLVILATNAKDFL